MPHPYQYGAFGQRLGKFDNVDQLFKHRRATVSLGYIGLYEVASVFYGSDWETNPEAKAFTLDIVKAMKNACESWSDEYDYHFSVYSTPSESLTDRFCRLDTEKFGVVTDITDKEYYTNSFHYDVRKNPTPFEKLEFEKAYPEAGALVDSSITANIQSSSKIQRHSKLSGTLLMTVSVTSERILQSINATSVTLKGTSPQQNVDSCALTVATQILKQLMLLNVLAAI